jgi:hypothetical protein
MRDLTPDEERRGSMCPECPDTRGLAVATSVSAGLKTVRYRCPSCDRVWETTGPDEKLPTLT